MVCKLVLNQGTKRSVSNTETNRQIFIKLGTLAKKQMLQFRGRFEADLDPDPESDQGQRDANTSSGI